MLINRICLIILMTGLGAGAAQALDPNLTPAEAFRSGYEAYKAGDAATALEALNYAAANGHPGALWKLGRMYQTGDLVAEDDRKAMQLFTQVANEYGDENPHGPDAPFVADAFVTLGTYYQSGIPGEVVADPGRARRFFAYAASYFGDSDAQYSLATMLLAGPGRRPERPPGGALVQACRAQGPCRRAGGIRSHALRGHRRGPAPGRRPDVADDRAAFEPRRSGDPGAPRAGLLNRRRSRSGGRRWRWRRPGWRTAPAARRRKRRRRPRSNSADAAAGRPRQTIRSESELARPGRKAS